MEPIPQKWVQEYASKLLSLTEKLSVGDPMRVMATLRAEHAMDLLKAWRERNAITEG